MSTETEEVERTIETGGNVEQVSGMLLRRRHATVESEQPEEAIGRRDMMWRV